MSDELVERLARQLFAHFRDRDPDQHQTRVDLEGTVARIQLATEQLDGQRARKVDEELGIPFENRHRSRISDDEASQIVEMTLARLRTTVD